MFPWRKKCSSIATLLSVRLPTLGTIDLMEEVKRKEDNFVHCKLNANEGRRTQ